MDIDTFETVVTGWNLVSDVNTRSFNILLLPQPCEAYKDLSAYFPLNKTFYETVVFCFCKWRLESPLDDLIEALGVTVGPDGSITQKDGYSFWKAQGKVKKDGWLNHNYTPVLKIKDLKVKLQIRVSAWKTNEEQKQRSLDSLKRPRTIIFDAQSLNYEDSQSNPRSLATVKSYAEEDTDTSLSYASKLKAIRACQTINEFIEMYDCGIVYDCLQRLRTSFSYYDPNLTLKERAECWATKLRNPHDAEAQAMDQDRKCCLESLYTMCNRWDPPKDGEEKTVSEDDIIHRFQTKRILGILLPYCLPMDRAKSLYFMVSAKTGQRGIHWFAKHHKEKVNEEVLIGYEPSINKRYFKLLGLKELELDKLPILADLLQYTLLEEIQWTESMAM